MTLQSDIVVTDPKQAGAAKRKRRVIPRILLLIVIVAGAAIVVWQLTRPSFATLEAELDYLVTDLVKSDRQIKNSVLMVMKGDGSFTWAGAAGIANQDGQVPMRPDTPIYIASTTKLYTAVTIMRLYEEGMLALDDPIARYLPPDLIKGIHVYEGHDYSGEITIEQLVANTSGIADYYDDAPEGGKNLSELFFEDTERVWTADELIAWTRDKLKPRFAPGTGAYYSDTNYMLLGKIIETVTGKPLHVVYDEIIFQPLSLKHTWLSARSEPQEKPVAPAEVFAKETNVTQVRSNGSYWADGGIVSTVGDSITFLKALNEGQIIRQDTLALMHSWRPLQNEGKPFQYGYGTMYFEVPWVNAIVQAPPIWGHTGSNSTFLYYAEDIDLYMAGTLNQTDAQAKAIMLIIQVMQAVS